MAASTNINGWNIGGNNNSFDQRGHFYRAFLDGNVSGMLVKQNSTPNMTVLVEHGSALLNKNTTSASVAEIKSDTSVVIDTANTSNPRIDTVVIYEDTSVAIPTVEANYWQDGAGGRFKLVSLPGTAGASPVALSDASIQTAIGAGKPWARLANITVPANSTTIVNSNINNNVRSKLGVSLANMNGGTNAGMLSSDGNGGVVSTPFSLYFTEYTNTPTSGATSTRVPHNGFPDTYSCTIPAGVTRVMVEVYMQSMNGPRGSRGHHYLMHGSGVALQATTRILNMDWADSPSEPVNIKKVFTVTPGQTFAVSMQFSSDGAGGTFSFNGPRFVRISAV